jgi:excisionase family DNA binding protein
MKGAAMAPADLKVEDVARRLNVNPETVRRWLRSGKIRGYSLGSDRGGWRIPVEEVERIRSGQTTPAPLTPQSNGLGS